MTWLDWRIYYADGSAFSSADGEWAHAPARGVICLLRTDEQQGRTREHGRGFYIHRTGHQAWGVDWPGLWDYLHEVGHAERGQRLRDVNLDALVPHVKFGRSVDNTTFDRIMAQADRDTDFPPYSARDRADGVTGEA